MEILLVVLALGVALLVFTLVRERKVAAERYAAITHGHDALARRVAERNRFRAVLDAEGYASEGRGQAERDAATHLAAVPARP